MISCNVLFELVYNFSQDELAALREYFNENLKKGFIQHSKFPIDALKHIFN